MYTITIFIHSCSITGLIGRLISSRTGILFIQIAAESVELFYNDIANKTQRAQITQEFYGPEFALFKEESYSSLTVLMETHPEKKKAVLEYMKGSLQGVLDK